MALSRDTELRIQGHLREVRCVNDETIESRQGLPPAITGYERTFQSVAECATQHELDQVAEYVKDRIRRQSERPSNRDVRRTARSLISQAGYPADEFLNAA